MDLSALVNERDGCGDLARFFHEGHLALSARQPFDLPSSENMAATRTWTTGRKTFASLLVISKSRVLKRREHSRGGGEGPAAQEA